MDKKKKIIIIITILIIVITTIITAMIISHKEKLTNINQTTNLTITNDNTNNTSENNVETMWQDSIGLLNNNISIPERYKTEIKNYMTTMFDAIPEVNNNNFQKNLKNLKIEVLNDTDFEEKYGYFDSSEYDRNSNTIYVLSGSDIGTSLVLLSTNGINNFRDSNDGIFLEKGLSNILYTEIVYSKSFYNSSANSYTEKNIMLSDASILIMELTDLTDATALLFNSNVSDIKEKMKLYLTDKEITTLFSNMDKYSEYTDSYETTTNLNCKTTSINLLIDKILDKIEQNFNIDNISSTYIEYKRIEDIVNNETSSLDIRNHYEKVGQASLQKFEKFLTTNGTNYESVKDINYGYDRFYFFSDTGY